MKNKLHPEYNFIHVKYWQAKRDSMKYRDHQRVEEDFRWEMESPDNDVPTHAAMEIIDDEYYSDQKIETFFEGYFAQNDKSAIELIKFDCTLFEYATDEQKDDELMVLEVIKAYRESQCEDYSDESLDKYKVKWVVPDMSDRLKNEYEDKSIAEFELAVKTPLLIAKERHRLESVTSKPRFTFDFEKKAATVDEAPKPKMRMKI